MYMYIRIIIYTIFLVSNRSFHLDDRLRWASRTRWKLDHTEAILRQGVHCSSSELSQGLHAAWMSGCWWCNNHLEK